MTDFFNQIFFNNSIRDYAIVVAIILFAYLMKKYVGSYVSRLFFFTVKQFGRDIDKQAFTSLVHGPIDNFLFLLISYIALINLNFPELLYFKFMKTDTQKLFEKIGTAILILTFFRLLLRGIDYIALVMEKKADLTPDQSDNQLVVFFKDFLKVIMIILGLLMLLRFAFNQNITNILAGLSLAGAAIALAARESLENLIASFIIFFDKPFTTGDLLKINNITGTVERIGLRSTRIRTVEKTYVTIPNKQMVDSVVDNLSLRTQRRAELKLEIELKTSAEQTKSLIAGLRKLMDKQVIIQKSVLLSDISADAFLINCEYYTDTISIDEFNNLKQDFNLNVISLLEELKIEIAGAGKDNRIKKSTEK
jgi:MscS family membrane protein